MQRRSPSFYRRRRDKQQVLQFNANERIKAPRILVIDENGVSLGELDTKKALIIAKERELDLIEVQPKANPPICKILNLGQFQYEQEKHKQKQKARQKKVDIKAIRVSFRIGEHDKKTKQMQARKFIEQGHKVKIDVVLKGREKAYIAQAKTTMEDFANSLDENIIIEQPFTKQGGRLSMIVAKKS
ncbi:MAG: translation initiation factor IF-3 [Parcubacteria group bacterium CG_4_9_14_0_2_um_filter_41_8]|nr:MAG: translation initiation factor IF-3 [Parcubacteria group bacterium CG1_02_41_12]PIP67240.1 MAG: translation initiation factor IF-3 [Parcubacteria group bacterium CG22_combo_CG10-13_8_21_14_all_41_9]PIQ80178.1 MAG: translation initiation factor IF-3 [Parcubacteria group bacterium CG11_big_fil_rev_8_21_14_0_20_41_14]PIR56811.1 MAG: translation initiation factor IF-3 [Parcubacteria group bacterium CG10_big_fil_rev_8_21_14_0_10_41_35]PIZ80343.1 MAG: translation initiation factor IF-3 [Parcub